MPVIASVVTSQYVVAPFLHYRTAPLHGSLATIGPLRGVLNDMSERGLGQIARNVGLVAAPISKRTSKTMICRGPAHSTLQQHEQGHGRLRCPIPAGKDKIVVGAPQQFHFPQYGQRPGT
jgi:hypothetical protein